MDPLGRLARVSQGLRGFEASYDPTWKTAPLGKVSDLHFGGTYLATHYLQRFGVFRIGYGVGLMLEIYKKHGYGSQW